MLIIKKKTKIYFRFTLKISIFALRNKNYNHRKKNKIVRKHDESRNYQQDCP